ncbi:zinc finger MYND domain-containing protein [Aspergillus stella-maris]|uniref:zinc finger MYND domain-containing protein n=1 Tax=Aspergillus stella-maris TaxID=1810926 RepID=UPI003CCD6F15
MVSVNDSPCANCGIPATLRCTGYKDAPDYEPGDVKAVFYCTAACQKEHRPQHKTYCKTMTTRKKLLRIAAICKAAVLGYRAVEFDVELSGIELKGNTLLLYDNQKDFTIAPKCGLFPEHVTSNPEHRDAALSWLFCHASLALLSSLLPKLLEDIPCKVEHMSFWLTKPLIITQVVPALGGHGVLKISLLSSSTEEAWVLDVTSAQYGFQNPLEPCMRYIADRGCIDLRLNAYNFTVTSDLDVALSRLCTNELQMRMCRAELPARRRFAAFVNGGPDKSILDGSAALFEERLKKFKLALKLNMCI